MLEAFASHFAASIVPLADNEFAAAILPIGVLLIYPVVAHSSSNLTNG